MSACAHNADLCFTRGDTGRIDVVVKQANGSAYNLTGCTLFLTVKTALTVADGSADVSKTVTTHDDAAAGESHFDLTTSDNDLAGTFYYDVQLKDAAGKIFTLFGGLWRVLGDVTTRTT